MSGARSSDLVAVFGVGGLGHLAMQYAAIAGAAVVAVDVNREKLELARELGASTLVNPLEEDPVAAIQRLGGADAAIALAVQPRAFEQALRSLRRGGTLVFVALPADNAVQAADLRDRARGSRSSARSSAPATTCARSSSCTPRAHHSRSPRRAARRGQRGDRVRAERQRRCGADGVPSRRARADPQRRRGGRDRLNDIITPRQVMSPADASAGHGDKPSAEQVGCAGAQQWPHSRPVLGGDVAACPADEHDGLAPSLAPREVGSRGGSSATAISVARSVRP